MNRKTITWRWARFSPTELGLVLLAGVLLWGCAHAGTGSKRAPAGEWVRFSYVGPGRTVCVSGDFNGWSKTAHCLEKNSLLIVE